MSHDPARGAAEYLGGVMRARRRDRFEQHLLGCEQCWREVSAGREGRRLAESVREMAPQGLRESIRAATAATAADRPAALRWWRPAVGAALAVALAGSIIVMDGRDRQPAPIVRAVADFTSARLPNETAARVGAPDLTSAGLTLTGSGSGTLEGLRIDAFAYRDADGDRVLVYLSDGLFPVASGARRSSADGPWRATIGDIELLCAQEPHALLAVSDDAAALDAVAGALRIDGLPA